MAISTSSHVGSRAEGDTGIDCHPCGNPYINVGHIHKYPDLKVPIVCAKETAATDKNSASGSPDVMTCSVVYRYRFHYRIKTEDQKAQISRAEAFIIVCVGAQGFRNKGGTLGTPRHKHKNDWINQMIGEILENFLMAIEYRNLQVTIEGQEIKKEDLRFIVARNQKYAKDAYSFNKILTAEPEKVIEETYNFHGFGQLRLRLLYANDLNKKILVVRKSGMKISEIKGLPKGISYTGILELQGERLNSFFREMENPTHDKWEPNRHSNPDLAKQYKKEVEDWVKTIIRLKVEELSGAEVLIDTGNMFNTVGKSSSDDSPEQEDAPKQEKLIDTTKSVEVIVNTSKTTSVKSAGGSGRKKVAGSIDDVGPLTGHRHRDGKKPQSPTGRKGKEDNTGRDSVYSGMTYVNVHARVINVGNGINRLICIPEKALSYGEVQVFATGENGKSLPLRISHILKGTNSAVVKDGKIILHDVNPQEKVIIDFEVSGRHTYALGVEVSGNQK